MGAMAMGPPTTSLTCTALLPRSLPPHPTPVQVPHLYLPNFVHVSQVCCMPAGAASKHGLKSTQWMPGPHAASVAGAIPQEMRKRLVCASAMTVCPHWS